MKITNFTRPPESEIAVEINIYHSTAAAVEDYNESFERTDIKSAYGNRYSNKVFYNPDRELEFNPKNVYAVEVYGYSQGDVSEILIDKSMPEVNTDYLQKLCFDSPVCGTIKLGEDKFYVDEILSNRYEYDRQEIINHFDNEVYKSMLEKYLPKEIDWN